MNDPLIYLVSIPATYLVMDYEQEKEEMGEYLVSFLQVYRPVFEMRGFRLGFDWEEGDHEEDAAWSLDITATKKEFELIYHLPVIYKDGEVINLEALGRDLEEMFSEWLIKAKILG